MVPTPDTSRHLCIPHQSRGVIATTLLIASALLTIAITDWRPHQPSIQTTQITYPVEQWASLPGVSITDQRAEFTPALSSIVTLTGAEDQPNPPVNIGGSYIQFDGDFTIRVNMSNLHTGSATFRIYAQPPAVYDEWRQEPPSVAVHFEAKRVIISQWDGSHSQTTQSVTIPREPEDNQTLTLQRRDDSLLVSVNNQPLTTLSAPSLFARGTLWLGADEAIDSWQISALTISSTNSTISLAEPLTTIPAYRAGLAIAASARRADFAIGAAVSLYPLLSDSKYHQIATSEFTSITPENELKPQFIHPQETYYRWQHADLLVKAAHNNNQAIHGHTLVFGEANPAWMRQSAIQDRERVMIEHVSSVVTHFKGKIASWDVVNEPLSDNDTDYQNGGNGLRKHMWYEAMGESYIDKAFAAAHAADPDTELYLNDYGLEDDGQRWSSLIALLTRLKARGVPIDGVGLQAHVYSESDGIDSAVLQRHIAELANLGLKVRISENDVYGDNPEAQAGQYSLVLRTCLQAPNCTSYTTWGITDKFGSTTEQYTYPAETGNDLLWDNNYASKPAYKALLQALQRN